MILWWDLKWVLLLIAEFRKGLLLWLQGLFQTLHSQGIFLVPPCSSTPLFPVDVQDSQLSKGIIFHHENGTNQLNVPPGSKIKNYKWKSWRKNETLAPREGHSDKFSRVVMMNCIFLYLRLSQGRFRLILGEASSFRSFFQEKGFSFYPWTPWSFPLRVFHIVGIILVLFMVGGVSAIHAMQHQAAPSSGTKPSSQWVMNPLSKLCAADLLFPFFLPLCSCSCRAGTALGVIMTDHLCTDQKY